MNRMLSLALIFVLTFAGTITALHHYHGNKVLRIKPQNMNELTAVTKLEELGVDFWRGPDRVNHFADLMVTPNNEQMILSYLAKHKIGHSVMINDVERLVEHERKEQNTKKRTYDGRGTSHAEEAIPGFYTKFQRYSEINKLMDVLVEKNPNIATKIKFGSSYEKRDLNLIRIGIDSSDSKKAVFIEGGIHAREWISPATVTYFAEQLVNGYNSNNKQIVQLLTTFDIYIAPVLNVDGYEYTHTTSRLWRKTRRPTSSSSSCIGADPNRNYGHQWGGTGASTNPCSEIYRGDSAFSEYETKAESDYILKNLKGRAQVFLAVHSYGQYWLYPWGCNSSLTAHNSELNAKAKIATSALSKQYNTEYTVGTSTNVLYAAAGGADDWAYAEANIVYSYTVELRDTGKYGFQLPASLIIPTASETTDGFLALLQSVQDSGVSFS